MFSERSAECEDIKKFAGSFEEDLMLSIERLSGDEMERSLQSDWLRTILVDIVLCRLSFYL